MQKKRGLGIDVVTAARQRVLEAFTHGKMVQLTFSGGKDSIVLADIVYNLLIDGKINKDQLCVIFIDEEAMYDSVIDIVKKWRTKFMLAGVQFDWFCIPVKHYNCLNTMTDDETFICWDPRKKDVWVRPMPDFAITDDPFLIPYQDNYQSFLERRDAAYKRISMRGIRVAESVQRRSYFAKRSDDGSKVSLPIYDMTDQDVWLYILKYNCELPDVYENLYRIGRPINRMRISQFFSIDTVGSLVSLEEMYPGLMERVTKREPNAYLCALYWDTEMFGRRTRKREELEKGEEQMDYRAAVMELLRQDPPKHPDMLFPQDAKTAGKWFKIVQHTGQAQYYKEHNLDLLLLGRRRADGNYVGKGDNIYTNAQGITRYSPLANWTHEEILACIHYYKLPLPPIYGWKNGYLCGTHNWAERQWTGSIENGWREVYEIDPGIVTEAAKYFDSAKEFLYGKAEKNPDR